VVVAPVVVPVDASATLSLTVDPSGCSLPAGGACATTVPGARSDGTETRLTSKPAFRSVSVACEDVVPTTSGTLTTSVPVVVAAVVAACSSSSRVRK
jgi:hypothetical protein